MPNGLSGSLLEYVEMFSKGLAKLAGPEVAQGVLLQILRLKEVDREKATKWVESNTSLWRELEPEYQERLRLLAKKAGNLDFLDGNWVINAIKGDMPALASLFLGWKKAHNWLDRQTEHIKAEVMKS